MSLLDQLTTDFKPWLYDTAERAAKTFLQVFVLTLIASGWFTTEGIVDLSIVQKAALAAGGAGLSVISSALSKIKGPPSTASFVQPAIEEAKVEAAEDKEPEVPAPVAQPVDNPGGE